MPVKKAWFKLTVNTSNLSRQALHFKAFDKPQVSERERYLIASCPSVKYQNSNHLFCDKRTFSNV